jgi:thiol:disulfide interchange protein DsbA
MRRALLLLTTTLFALGAAAATLPSVGKWRAGSNYSLVSNPQPTAVGNGKVEVIEVFWYGCGHCYELDPALEQWNRAKPSYIEFVRVPVMWGPQHRQHAKLFYTLQVLKRPDLHAKVFDAIHKDGYPLSNPDEVKARALQFGFLSTHGIDDRQFDAAHDSMTVAVNMQRAEALTRAYSVSSVPVVFINGKYSTGVTEAGGANQLTALINDLAASEKPR